MKHNHISKMMNYYNSSMFNKVVITSGLAVRNNLLNRSNQE
jgi:hypothetical protein